MNLANSLNANQVIQRLRSTYGETQHREETLEETRDCLRQLFDAVSDAVFLYQSGQITLHNENGGQLLEAFADQRDALAAEIYRKSAQVLLGLPVTLTPALQEKRKVLVIHSAKALRLETGNALLVTVVDLSEAMANTAQLEQASSAERRRIAKDLHDGLSQLLTSLKFQSQALARRHQGSPQSETYARIAALALLCAQKGMALHHEFYEI